MEFESTIVAVSSASGTSSHVLIRASGKRAWSGVKKLGIQIEPRQLVRGHLCIGTSSLPVLVLSFPADSSFTGQDTVEIQLVNNSTIVELVLHELINAMGGRFAQAGEFTARAFLHGTISLSAAEGVCATISANNDAELLGASLLRSGALAKATEPVSAEIKRALALVEAGIDFTDEEDVVAISEVALRGVLQDCIQKLTAVLEGKITMESLRALPRVVLAGAPNAGKSTLFNALLGRRRAVISSLSGTTRDAIAEQTYFGNKEVLLVDIAGNETANDPLSASMQRVATREINTADVLLWCVVPECNIEVKHKNAIIVHTKGDLKGACKTAIQAMTGFGIPALKERVASILTDAPTPRLDALALLPRHEYNLQKTIDALLDALEQIATPELTAASLREALNAIGAITGQVTPDEIIGEVFSTFCVGK
jgi:tRNA modification GTPase